MSSEDGFRAFLAVQGEDGFERGVGRLGADELPDGEVTIAVAYSSVNYKDGLAASENGRVARVPRLAVGIDLAGTVVASTDPAFAAGQEVIAHGYEIGVARHGGYAERARVPAEWVVPLPAGLACARRRRSAPPASPRRCRCGRSSATASSPATARSSSLGATGGVGSSRGRNPRRRAASRSSR